MRSVTTLACLCALLLSACGDDRGTSPTPPVRSGGPPPPVVPSAGPGKAPATTAAVPDAPSSIPAGAVAVRKARVEVPSGDVVVYGRVHYMVPGLAAFTLIDAKLEYCHDACDVPWDYCCLPPEEVAAHDITVERRGADGQPIAMPSDPHVRNLDLVAVSGRLQKDDKGQVTLVAASWKRLQRPTDLPADIKFEN